MKVTVRHYYDFRGLSQGIGQSLDNADSWDTLRLQDGTADNVFAIPSSREAWERRCYMQSFLESHAQAIVRFVRGRFTRINSYGVGTGILEFFIKKQLPEIFLQCSDYTVRSIDRLRQVFMEADEIIQFDMLNDAWNNDGLGTLYLFYRMDTCFDDDQWRTILANMCKHGVTNILFVPSEFLTFQRFLIQKLKYYFYKFFGKRIIFAGYLRTRSQFFDLLTLHYSIEQHLTIGNLTGFLLTIKENS